MTTLEGHFSSDVFAGELTLEKESKEKEIVTYEAIEVNSFPQAVEKIIKDKKNEQSFCFVDFDQTITGSDLRNVRDPKISAEVKVSFNDLLGSFSPGRLCLTTNRGYGSSALGNFIFKTDKALEKMTEFLEESSYPGTVPIFLGLKKQVPNLKVNGREELIEHLVNFVVSNDFKDKVEISMIEDYSLVGLDRSVFPRGIANEVHRKLKEEHNREVSIDIKDYILKR